MSKREQAKHAAAAKAEALEHRERGLGALAKKDDTTAVLELISSNSSRDESAVIPFINSSRGESAAGPRVAPMPRSLLRQRETERPRGDHEPSAPPWAGGPP